MEKEKFYIRRKIIGATFAAGAAVGIDISGMSHAEAPAERPEVYSGYVQVAMVRSNYKILPGIYLGSVPTVQPLSEVVQESHSVQEESGIVDLKESEARKSWIGIATWYSREGCVGCSENLLMANGEELNDGKFTAAFNKVPLGSRIRITNLENGNTIDALVTDTGGFEDIGDGRIVDVTPIVRDALGFIDMTRVKIDLISEN